MQGDSTSAPEPVNSDGESSSPKKLRSRAEAFSAIIRDKKLSHGAFRLWHALRDHQNPRTLACFPGQRLLAFEIGCDAHSLKKWTDELVSAEWLAIEPGNRGQSTRYFLLDGQGQVLGKTTSPSVGENHITSRRPKKRGGKPQRSDGENHNAVMGKTTAELIEPKGSIENKLISEPVDPAIPAKEQDGSQGSEIKKKTASFSSSNGFLEQ